MNAKFATVMIALVGLLAMTSGCIETGTGQQTGNIYAIDCGGVFRDVCVVYIKSTAESSDPDVYCLDDEAASFSQLHEQLEGHMERNHRVKITYHTEMFVGPSRCGPNDIIDSVALVV